MITSEEVAVALRDWVQGVLPEVVGAYAHVPTEKPEGLPDVVVEVVRTATAFGGGDRFAAFDIQQALVYSVEADVSFMVDNANTATAAAQLRDFEHRLVLAVMADATLGGRVPFVSPELAFDFGSPYVEYEDGTKGRELTMTIAVGDLVEAS